MRSAIRAKSPSHSRKSCRNAERSSSRRKLLDALHLRTRERERPRRPGSVFLAGLGEEVEEQPRVDREDDAARPVLRARRSGRRAWPRGDPARTISNCRTLPGHGCRRDRLPALARKGEDDRRPAPRDAPPRPARARTRPPGPAPPLRPRAPAPRSRDGGPGPRRTPPRSRRRGPRGRRAAPRAAAARARARG